MTSSADKTEAARETIVSQQDRITKMTEITPESIDQLQEEVGNILTMVKSWHFEKGREFGHLAIILEEEEYQDVIGDDTWTYP